MLIYNSIELQVEHVNEFRQTPVYSADGKDLLYTHIFISTRSIWNARATSNNGKCAAESIADMRQALLTPRKVLRFVVPSGGAAGESVMLECPLKRANGERYPCDANNGPAPVSLNVVEIIGEWMCVVDYAIECWVVECETMNAIRSHRWDMTHDINRDYLTTRYINGTAVLRADYLNRTTPRTHADSFRHVLFHPVPDGFTRTKVFTKIRPDGLTIDYTIVDEEQSYPIDQSRSNAILRVEGRYTEGIGTFNISPTQVVKGLVKGAVTGGPAGAAAGGASGVSLPRATMELEVHVWGRPGCTKTMLKNALIRAMVAFRFAGAASPLGIIRLPSVFFNDVMFTTSLDKPYAVLNCRANMSGSYALLLRSLGVLPGLGSTNIDQTVVPEGIPNVTLPKRSPASGFGLLNDSGSREEYVEQLAAAALKAPCDRIATPTNSGV